MHVGFQAAQLVPALFVFMGNFHSRGGSGAAGRGPGGTAPSAGAGAGAAAPSGGAQGGGTSYAAMRAGFDKLAALLQQYPRIQVRVAVPVFARECMCGCVYMCKICT